MMESQESETEYLLQTEKPQKVRYGYGSRDIAVKVEVPDTASGIPINNDEWSSTITFRDICCQVKCKKMPCSCTSVTKQILKNIHGIFKPGMNAVMGPTGSGKTSLLDVLACRKSPNGLSGTVLMDGKPLPHNFRLMVGYVAQEDKVMGTLTIRENLTFSAALRLPKTITKEDRNQRVNQVLVELGLMEVADSKVGTVYIRGVSGGERKRCNIGMELIISPPLLFLDEPTTGLDASTANAVMMLLRKLSLKGRNIIFSIHQPRYSIYRHFDSLMLLSHGLVVYHGPSMGALEYFESIGFVCGQFNNPADFYLDVINGDSSAVISQHEDGNEDNYKEVDPSSLNQRYLSSKWWKKIDEELNQVTSLKITSNTRIHPGEKVNYKRNFASQLMTVSGRAIKNLYRNPGIYYSQLSYVILFGLVVGGVYYQLNDSSATAIQNRTGALFFIIMNLVFGNMSAVDLFIKERAIFIHENIGGYYRTSAYFLAKVFCDVIPLRLFPALVSSAISYYMIGLRGGLDYFAIFVLTSFLASLSSAALSFFFSSTVNVTSIATLCLSLCYVFMMILSGFLLNVGSLGDWIDWVKYFSIFRYGLNALSINELKDRNFCGNSTGSDNNPPGCIFPGNKTCDSGNAYLQRQHIDYKTLMDFWWNIIALGILTVGFLMMTYIQLIRIKKLK